MYSIVFEDNNFLIVNKKAGVIVHKTKFETENNLIDIIRRDRGENYFLVNRIDRFTSGIVILAKDKDVFKLTQNLFSDRKIEKTYLAIISKELPAKKVMINLSIGRSRKNKLKFSNLNSKNYKSASTEVEEICGKFISIKLITGRTHQIRCHLSEIGCPVLNDPVYGKEVFDLNFGQFLHAYKINFFCPISSKKITAIAPIPQEFFPILEDMNIEYKKYVEGE